MDEMVEIVDDSQPVLYPEILSHIFAYLRLTDRKEVRLTCRSWYYNSLCPAVVKSEKYVFRANVSVEEIADLMLRSDYSLLNLEFQGIRVNDLPADVWKVCGERIRTLEFYKCQWNLDTMKNVILYCTNLTSIVIKSIRSCPEATGNPMEILCSSYVLDDLIEKGIRRSELRTFALFNEGVQLSESVLNKVFLLFPGIKHFSTGLVSFEIPFVHGPILYLRDPPVSLSLDQYFNPETQLESLTLNLPMDGNWMETLVQKAKQGIRLKKLETILIYRRNMTDSLFDFFKSQTNLEVLKLGIGESNFDENMNKKLFFHILDNCPNLQEFHFETQIDLIHLEPSELPRFIACTRKLKLLKAFFDVTHCTPAPLYQDLLAKHAQVNLTSLRWANLNVDFCVALLQRCPSLMHLQFDGRCDDATLQIIFQFLVELRTLVLHSIHPSCTDYGFTGRSVDGRPEGYSIKRLKQLKYLKLRALNSRLTQESALELQLPRLEFLSLTATWFTEMVLCEDEVLDHFASHLPELRVLDVGRFSLEGIMAMRVCQRFKHLHRVVCLANFSGHDDEMAHAKCIFRSCPRLRYIRVCGAGLFFYDSCTGVVLRKDLYAFKFPGNVFDGDCGEHEFSVLQHRLILNAIQDVVPNY